jgi:hypothetical protein
MYRIFECLKEFNNKKKKSFFRVNNIIQVSQVNNLNKLDKFKKKRLLQTFSWLLR